MDQRHKSIARSAGHRVNGNALPSAALLVCMTAFNQEWWPRSGTKPNPTCDGASFTFPCGVQVRSDRHKCWDKDKSKLSARSGPNVSSCWLRIHAAGSNSSDRTLLSKAHGCREQCTNALPVGPQSECITMHVPK